MRRLGSIALIAVLVAAFTVGLLQPTSPASYAADVDEPLPVDDMATIAAMLGVPLAEASRQVELQDALDHLDLDRLDPAFVEVRTSPGPDFRVDYFSTEEAPRDVRSAMDALGAADVQYHVVPHSLEELESARRAVHEAHRGAPLDTVLDVPNGRVIAYASTVPSATVRTAADRAAGQVHVRWEVGMRSEPTLGGGYGMRTARQDSSS